MAFGGSAQAMLEGVRWPLRAVWPAGQSEPRCHNPSQPQSGLIQSYSMKTLWGILGLLGTLGLLDLYGFALAVDYPGPSWSRGVCIYGALCGCISR